MKNHSYTTLFPNIKRALQRVCQFTMLLVVLVSALRPPQNADARPLNVMSVGTPSNWHTVNAGSASETVECHVSDGVVYCSGTTIENDTNPNNPGIDNQIYISIPVTTTGNPESNFYISTLVTGTAGGSFRNLSSSESWVDIPAYGTNSIINHYQNSISIQLQFTNFGGYGTFTNQFYITISDTGYVDPIEPGDCSDAFIDKAFIASNLDIDPRIEFPNGPDVELPLVADQQKVGIAPLTVGDPDLAAALTGETNILHLSVSGLWNTTRDDYAYSFDGTTWASLMLLPVLCFSDEGWWFEITDEEYFYIRANDDAGQFSDNTPTAAPFPTWSLAIVEQINMLTCSDKFEYDEQDDWLASGTIPGNDADGVLPAATLVVGDWYAIETAGNPWYENGEARYDITAAVEGVIIGPSLGTEFSIWEYTDCVEATGVSEHKRYYFQSPSDTITLRVNDQDNNFQNNTGQIGYNLYHVEMYEYFPQACENKFEVDDEIAWKSNIDAKKDLGVPLYPLNMLLGDNWDDPLFQTEFDYYFVPGQWYMLETKNGPWLNGSLKSWELEYSDDNGTSWDTYTEIEWDDCAVPIDKVGHVRIYFRAIQPNVDDVELEARWNFKVRVRDTTNTYGNNSGSMDYEVYRAINAQVDPPGPNPEGACNGYTKGAQHSSINIPPKWSNGESIPSLISDNTYAIETRGYWTDGSDPGHLTTAQISGDGGDTWFDWDEYPSILCSEPFTTQDGTFFRLYLKAIPGSNYRVRADTGDSNFADNTDGDGDDRFGIDIFEAVYTYDPFNTCAKSYKLTKLNGGNLPASFGGRTDPSDAVAIDLVFGNLYAIEISSLFYFDSGSEEPLKPRADFQLSFDTGATWYDWNDPEMPGFLCNAEMKDLIAGITYGRVYFNSTADYAQGDYPRIRVKDFNDDYTDNLGALIYVISGVSDAGDDLCIDCYDPPKSIAGCAKPPIRPITPAMTITEIPAWMNYLATSVGYYIGSITYFWLWCPQHTTALKAILADVKTLEPFKTIDRINTAQKQISTQVESYSWDLDDTPAVPFGDSGGTEIQSLIPDFSDSPFTGAPIQYNTDLGGGTESIESCDAHLVLTMGDSPLVQGFCTVMSFLKMTSLNVMVNIAIVLSSILLFIRYLMKHWVHFLVKIASHSG